MHFTSFQIQTRADREETVYVLFCNNLFNFFYLFLGECRKYIFVIKVQDWFSCMEAHYLLYLPL